MKCASLFLLLLHRIIRWGYFLTSKDTKDTKGIAWVFVYCLGGKLENEMCFAVSSLLIHIGLILALF